MRVLPAVFNRLLLGVYEPEKKRFARRRPRATELLLFTINISRQKAHVRRMRCQFFHHDPGEHVEDNCSHGNTKPQNHEIPFLYPKPKRRDRCYKPLPYNTDTTKKSGDGERKHPTRDFKPGP